MEMNQVIANNVRELRTSHNMTQRQFADSTGVSRSIVVNIEAKKGTSMQVLEQIARRFRVEVADLVKTEPIVDKSAAGMLVSDFDFEGEYDKLPDQHKRYGQFIFAAAFKYVFGGNINEILTSNQPVENHVITTRPYQETIERNSLVASILKTIEDSRNEIGLNQSQVSSLVLKIANSTLEIPS